MYVTAKNGEKFQISVPAGIECWFEQELKEAMGVNSIAVLPNCQKPMPINGKHAILEGFMHLSLACINHLPADHPLMEGFYAGNILWAIESVNSSGFIAVSERYIDNANKFKT